MVDGFWFSAMLGAGIGGMYGLSAYFMSRSALHKSNRAFMVLVLGGMSARLFLTLIVIAIILVVVPIDKTVFVTTFFALFLVGLVLEITILHRRQSGTAKRTD